MEDVLLDSNLLSGISSILRGTRKVIRLAIASDRELSEEDCRACIEASLNDADSSYELLPSKELGIFLRCKRSRRELGTVQKSFLTLDAYWIMDFYDIGLLEIPEEDMAMLLRMLSATISSFFRTRVVGGILTWQDAERTRDK